MSNTEIQAEWPDRRIFEFRGLQELSSNSMTVRQTRAYSSKAPVFAIAFRDTDHGATGTIVVPKDDALRLARAIIEAAGVKENS